MPKRRINLYLTEKQLERLHRLSTQENLPVAEIVRRAVDTYLAWDDPTYHPSSPALHKERRSHPPYE